MKKHRSLFFILIIILMYTLSGCQSMLIDNMESAKPDSMQNGENTDIREENNSSAFWIVMEQHEAMEHSVNYILDKFTEVHPEINVRLQVLPNGNKQGGNYQAARDAALQQLRTAIMAGRGPDIYLLPSVSTNYEMLFKDVNQAMANGYFEDISIFYNTDTELSKESFAANVMDAGTLDGARYVLPLRYDMPIAYVDTAEFTTLGGDLDMFDGGILSLFNEILATENPELAVGAFINVKATESFALNLLGQTVDYGKQEVLLKEETLSEFMVSIQRIRSANLIDPDNWEERIYVNYPNDLADLFSKGEFWTDETSFYIGTMQDILENAAYAEAMEIEIAMIPVADAEGKITADVTYYGAVGDACDDVALAYEFLRMFLTEDAQILQNRDTVDSGYYLGWPVLAKGHAEELWNSHLSYLLNFSPMGTDSEWSDIQKEHYQQCRSAIKDIHFAITSDDIPVLNVEADRVQFSIDLENDLSDRVYNLNDDTTCEPAEADINTLAAEFVDELKWHLAEG